jgi:hypothetical protein
MFYARPADVLNPFGGWLDADVPRQAKQIENYRDWLAHRNESEIAPVIAQPASVRGVLVPLTDAVESR